MTRHMSGPLREKPGSLLLGLFSLRDHVPPSVTPGTSRRAPPLTLFMPSLAGMWLVYLLWPAARVKGTFWPRSGRGHLRGGAMAEVLVEVVVCAWRWRQWIGGDGGGGTMGSWKSSVLCMFVIMCSWYIWMCDIAVWSKGNMPHCNCFWGMACTGRSLRVYRPPRRPLRVPEEKGAGVSWQCVEISVVPADVIQQMLTQTFLSVHIRSPAKVHPLCAERVYKYRLGQRDRTDTNLQNGVHANFKGFSHTHCGAWADSAHMPMTREGVKLIENNLITLQNQKLQTLKVKSYIKNSHSATGHRTLHWTRTS